MNTRIRCIAIALIGCAAAVGCVTTYPVYQTVPMGGPMEAPDPVVEDTGSDQPFYDDLAPYGRWVHVSGPGWVWSPYDVQVDWRPYQLGHWVYTDFGWTWASDETWGWATYHYGRWHQAPGYGWVWVPGTEWGPAWVAWNEGGGYVGWAPLPWQVHVQAGVGITSASLHVSIAPASWCFVSARNMVDVRLNNYIVPASRNVTIIRVTKNVTNYTYVDNRIINGGVHVDKIGRAAGRSIPRYRVSEAADVAEASRGRGNGREIPMYRPDPSGRRESNRREVPPGHSEATERFRQERHPVDRTEMPPRPPRRDAPPADQAGPLPDNGRGDQDRAKNPHENRGRKWPDATTGQPSRGRSPQSNRPQQPPPAPPAVPGKSANPSDAGVAPPSAPPAGPPSSPPPAATRPAQGDQHRVAPPTAATPKDKARVTREADRAKKQDPKKHAPDEDKDKKEQPDSND